MEMEGTQAGLQGEPSVTGHKTSLRGFPGGSAVKNPPANAGDMGSISGPGRSHMPQSSEAHAPQLLGLCRGLGATSSETAGPRACALQREATAVSSPDTAAREQSLFPATRGNPEQS